MLLFIQTSSNNLMHTFFEEEKKRKRKKKEEEDQEEELGNLVDGKTWETDVEMRSNWKHRYH